jgi:GWxTD domain-containing protein
MYKLQLMSGDYLLRLLVRDRHDPSRRDSLSIRLPVRAFSTTAPVLSDVELASVIRQGNKGGIFYKNTLDVVPNVGGMFSEDQQCYYYAEAYNMLANADTGEFIVRTNVYDAVGKEIISRERPRKRAGESSVIIDHLSVKNPYSAPIHSCFLLGDGKSLIQWAELFVQPTLGVDSTLLASASSMPMPQYMAMDESELDREFQWARYVCGRREGAIWSAEGVDAKRKFLSDFWRQEGSRRTGRVPCACRTRQHELPGAVTRSYRTDRGRVLVMYGQPDDVERHPNETETRPYEIWSYNNIQGGVIFVFVLRNAAGDYELVHSTHRNELHDEGWDRIGITR